MSEIENRITIINLHNSHSTKDGKINVPRRYPTGNTGPKVTVESGSFRPQWGAPAGPTTGVVVVGHVSVTEIIIWGRKRHIR